MLEKYKNTSTFQKKINFMPKLILNIKNLKTLSRQKHTYQLNLAKMIQTKPPKIILELAPKNITPS